MALVQPNLFWLDPAANRQHLSSLFAQYLSDVDLIVLPEMFTSGFTQHPESAQTDKHSAEESSLEWMKREASRYQAAIVGSIAYPQADGASDKPASFTNRLLFVTPSGDVSFYDKCHLFTMGGEHERYSAGNERKVISYLGWDILLTVCYDLRFPVFCRNRNDYDMMLCVANWPEPRRHPWRTLLQARAIENQAYVVGVNRVGRDGNGLNYQGDSLAVNYWGNILADGGDGCEQILQVEFDKEELLKAREAFPVAKDADLFELR